MRLFGTFIKDDHIWAATGGLAAIAASFTTRRLAAMTWKAFTHADPPDNPAARNASWASALAWGMLLGAVAGAGRVASKRIASEGWRKVRGSYPPGVDGDT